jgi:hypothetical protein
MNLIAKVIIIIIILLSILLVPMIKKYLFNTGHQQYFFFQDPDFINDGLIRYWKTYNWSHSLESQGLRYAPGAEGFAKYTNGTAHLFFNVSNGWAGAIFGQGTHPHGYWKYSSILGGTSRKTAKEVDEVIFLRDAPLPPGKFFFVAKVRVLSRNYTDFGNYTRAYAHVSPELMFAFDDAPYDHPDWHVRGAIHVDMVLSRVWWDRETKTLHHEEPEIHLYEAAYDADYHISQTVGKITELGKWYTFKIDLAPYIENIFKLLPEVNEIRFKGITVGIDGCSATMEAQYDYVGTKLEE